MPDFAGHLGVEIVCLVPLVEEASGVVSIVGVSSSVEKLTGAVGGVLQAALEASLAMWMALHDQKG